MRLFAMAASVPGRLNCPDSASPAGRMAATPPIATTSQSATIRRLCARTHRVRVAIALPSDIWAILRSPLDIHCKLTL
jgi:hypothetical protein